MHISIDMQLYVHVPDEHAYIHYAPCLTRTGSIADNHESTLKFSINSFFHLVQF